MSGIKILEGAIDDKQVKPIKIWLQKDSDYVKDHTPTDEEDDNTTDEDPSEDGDDSEVDPVVDPNA